MSVSEKQLIANRLNAKKSTGPRSPEGKAIVSQNAVKHGLYATRAVITRPTLAETRTDYESILGVLSAKLTPHSPLENFLVRRIANCAWQLKRSDRFSASLMNKKLGDLSKLTEAALTTFAKLYRRSQIFNRRLRHRIDRTHCLLLTVKQSQIAKPEPQSGAAQRQGPATWRAVKQSQIADVVQQLDEAITKSQNRCETNPLIERVL